MLLPIKFGLPLECKVSLIKSKSNFKKKVKLSALTVSFDIHWEQCNKPIKRCRNHWHKKSRGVVIHRKHGYV